ncbi:phage tail tube protein, partial [Salmonella enterica]
TGFTIEQAVNAMVTGSFPFIGLNQEILQAPPSGSDFTTNFSARPFASVDVSAYDGAAPLKLIDTFTITNDNSASAQFELGNNSVAFVERGRAANTFSLAGKLYDMTLLNKFLNETQMEVSSVLNGPDGAMSFTLKRASLTSA